MTNKTYDKLKGIALLVAPATAFVAALLNIWHIPYTAEITATLAAVDTFIGAVVTIAKSKWEGEKDGEDLME